MRPDRQAAQEPIEPHLWLDSASWRPILALLAHYRYIEIPSFPDVYVHRRGAPAADHLCGLWFLATSSFYRYLANLRLQIAQRWAEQAQTASLLFALLDWITAQKPNQSSDQVETAAQHREWAAATNREQTTGLLVALWHLQQATAYDEWVTLAQTHLVKLAQHPLTDELFAMTLKCLPAAADPFTRTRILLTHAAIQRTRDSVNAGNTGNTELDIYVSALHQCANSGDALSLAAIYGALGKYHEFRDPDRAFAYYQEALRYCDTAATYSSHLSLSRHAIQHELHFTMLIKLAWIYTNRNDPRAKALLERAEKLIEDAPNAIDDAARAMLALAQGEYLRREGDHQAALARKMQALLIYERMNNDEGKVKAYINLGNTYDDLQQYDRAIAYYVKVLQMSRTVTLDPDLLCTTQLNMGVCYFWQKNYQRAIDDYQRALLIATDAKLVYRMGAAHYNLAEAYYSRWIAQRDHTDTDEIKGDHHVDLAIALLRESNHLSLANDAAELKSTLIEGSKRDGEDRLLPIEQAAHFEEHTDIARLQRAMQTAQTPTEQVQIHIDIARAYLSLGMKEREAALALMQQHHLSDAFDDAIAQLRQTFERELTHEARLTQHWKSRTTDVLNEDKRQKLLAFLLPNGAISKSQYAKLCDVSAATASAHLGKLAERGLLVRVGNGPQTCYTLSKSTP